MSRYEAKPCRLDAYFLSLCLEWHFIPIGMNMSFHSVWNGLFIPFKMKWSHFIPVGMNIAFHSGWNGLFIPAKMKWLQFIPVGMN